MHTRDHPTFEDVRIKAPIQQNLLSCFFFFIFVIVFVVLIVVVSVIIILVVARIVVVDVIIIIRKEVYIPHLQNSEAQTERKSPPLKKIK